MKVHAIHDAKGNITRLILRPENGPPGGPAPSAGHFATEVDAAGLKIDAKDPKNYERLIDTMRQYRVDVTKAAKLVKKVGKRG